MIHHPEKIVLMSCKGGEWWSLVRMGEVVKERPNLLKRGQFGKIWGMPPHTPWLTTCFVLFCFVLFCFLFCFFEVSVFYLYLIVSDFFFSLEASFWSTNVNHKQKVAQIQDALSSQLESLSKVSTHLDYSAVQSKNTVCAWQINYKLLSSPLAKSWRNEQPINSLS